MLNWIDPVEVGGIAAITIAITGYLKRVFKLSGRRVQLVALFVACALASFRAIDRDPSVLVPGWTLARVLIIGVLTGFAAVAQVNAQKPRDTPANVDSEEGK
jgi:hypothetical protein